MYLSDAELDSLRVKLERKVSYHLGPYCVMPDNLLPDSLTPFPVWFFRFDSVRRAEPAARVRSGWDRILACVGKTEYPTLCEGL